MAVVLIPGTNIYTALSTDTPPAPVFGYQLRLTDNGYFYVASANSPSSWQFMGYSTMGNLGYLPRTGGEMLVPLVGAHGLMPLTGGDFSNGPTVAADVLALNAYVNQRDNFVLSQISPAIVNVFSQQEQISINANQVVAWGVTGKFFAADTTWNGVHPIPSDLLQTIPTPTFLDGTYPDVSEMQVFVNGLDSGNVIPPGLAGYLSTCPDPINAPLTWAVAFLIPTTWYTIPFNYLVIATRAGA